MIENSKPKRIVIMADWLPPDFGAVGQYALQFAEQEARIGHAVCLVGFSSVAKSEQSIGLGLGQLTVKRLKRGQYNRQNWLQRGWWTLMANLQLVRASFPEFSKADEVRFTGSPPYILHFVVPLAILLGRKTRYRITDFHPECLFAALGKQPFWSKPLYALTKFWRRRVDVMEVIGEDQAARLQSAGIKSSRIELKRDPSPVHFTEGTQKADVPTVLRGRKIILYSGNWGEAHDHHTFVNAMIMLERDFPNQVGVWLNATGKRVDAVAAALTEHGIALARTPPCELAQLPSVLMAADVHLITLLDAFVGYVLPSKVYACIDSNRPILFVGSVDSDVHLLCQGARSDSTYRQINVEETAACKKALQILLNL